MSVRDGPLSRNGRRELTIRVKIQTVFLLFKLGLTVYLFVGGRVYFGLQLQRGKSPSRGKTGQQAADIVAGAEN